MVPTQQYQCRYSFNLQLEFKLSGPWLGGGCLMPLLGDKYVSHNLLQSPGNIITELLCQYSLLSSVSTEGCLNESSRHFHTFAQSTVIHWQALSSFLVHDWYLLWWWYCRRGSVEGDGIINIIHQWQSTYYCCRGNGVGGHHCWSSPSVAAGEYEQPQAYSIIQQERHPSYCTTDSWVEVGDEQRLRQSTYYCCRGNVILLLSGRWGGGHHF